MLEHMIDKRPQADRLLVAEIWGEARRRARWRELGDTEEAAAVAALRDLAGGRADLLAEVAGVLEGAREGEPDEPLARQAAMLARKAGADPGAIPAWAAEGHRHGGRRSRADCDRRKGRRARDGARGAPLPGASPCRIRAHNRGEPGR
jgi:hypothetical protein